MALFVFVFLSCLVLAIGVTARRPARLAAGDGPSQAWVELGPNGVAVARVITGAASCPSIALDGGALPMQPRAQPAANYPLLVCEATLPSDASSAFVLGHTLPLPKARPERILILGDTGCRLLLEQRGEVVQACDDPQAWPAAQVAASAAAWKPDLVIHVGDYLYRESPCPPANDGCSGSPSGYNWASWNADFFTPLAPLLAAAPWILVRGDHELCARAGDGWFRFLDPRPLSQGCSDNSEPYAVPIGDLRLLVLDSANANDFSAVPDEVRVYRDQFAALANIAGSNAWLLTHRPVWVFGHLGGPAAAERLFRDNPTLQAASDNQLPDGVSLVVSGHIHFFESLAFAPARPGQLVVGNGGTTLDPAISTPLAGLQIAGATVDQGSVLSAFGFMTMERQGDAWLATLRDAAGAPALSCSIQGRTIDCNRSTTSEGEPPYPGAVCAVSYQETVAAARQHCWS